MPPRFTEPDPTINRFDPIAAIWSWICLFAPLPIATMAITAPTPMMMPSIVSAERSLLRAKARRASRNVARSSISVFDGRHRPQVFRGDQAVFHKVVGTDRPVAKYDLPVRELGGVRFVGATPDRQALFLVQALKDFHHFNGRATVEVS